MAKTIAIYFEAPGIMDYPFDDQLYYESYRAFSKFAHDPLRPRSEASRGLRIVIARGQSYRGQMRFSSGWEFVGGELNEIDEPIRVDLIYNKSRLGVLTTGPEDLVLNPPQFEATARNKWTAYQELSEFSPLTFVITDKNWREVTKQIPTDRIVLKPQLGFGGVGIQIVDKATFDFPSIEISEPYIAQAFIDSSGGIPDLYEGMHDLRVILFGGEPKLAFLRVPKAGSLLSNVSQGGHIVPIELEKVPTVVLDAARQIDTHFQEFTPRFYSADFCFQGDRPYLIEVNTQPGFPHPTTEGRAFTDAFYRYLVELFYSTLDTKKES